MTAKQPTPEDIARYRRRALIVIALVVLIFGLGIYLEHHQGHGPNSTACEDAQSLPSTQTRSRPTTTRCSTTR